MPARKRRATSPEPIPKRTRQDTPPTREIIEILDENESLESIVARIEEQERSEALAKQLSRQLNGEGGPSQPPHPGVATDDVIALDDEDDEALARRLAEEWAQEDEMLVDEPLPANDISDKGKVKETLRSTTRATVRTPISVQHSAGSNSEAGCGVESSLQTHKEVFVLTRPCTKCGKDVVSPRGYVTYTPQLPPPSLLALLHATCSSCKTSHCRGCFAPVPCSSSCKGTQKTASTGRGSSSTKDSSTYCPVVTCCAEVRTIALFEALGGFDRVYIGEQTTAEKRAKESAAKRRSAMGSIGPGGTGYGTGGSSGYGFGGHFGYGDDWDEDEEDNDELHQYLGHAFSSYSSSRGRGRGRGRGGSRTGRGQIKVQTSTSSATAMAAHWDEILVRALTSITTFLPAPYSDDAQGYDILPHASIPSLILMSRLPDLLGTLLRNDSVTDWTDRSEVYSAMLGLLRRFADSELTMQVLIDQRDEVKQSCGIEEYLWGDGEITFNIHPTTQKPTVAPPLFSYFKKLTKQCETFLAGASQMFEGDNAQDAGEELEGIVQATSLCGDMLAARDDIERAMKVMGQDPEKVASWVPPEIPDEHSDAEPNGSPSSRRSGRNKSKDKDKASTSSRKADKGKQRDPNIDIDRAYRLRCEQLSFSYVDLPDITQSKEFHYANLVKQTASATRIPKNRVHFLKELAVMATSLPPGIWVRVDETRTDAMKVMIAGPEGTPYSDGLFEFDCFIPMEYPTKPPVMNLCTTGGGSVRFNPNLYNCGKVCLSLLGTWAGSPEEMWRPFKSTLLQVFVSIQSMILIDLPYFNEPGFGQANASNPQSKSYNKNVSLHTTRWAIVDWLKDEHRNGIWGDVIASHFTIRELKIRECVEAWAKDDPRFKSYTSSIASGFSSMAPLASGGSMPYLLPPISPIAQPPQAVQFQHLAGGGSGYSTTGYQAMPYNDGLDGYGSIPASSSAGYGSGRGRGRGRGRGGSVRGGHIAYPYHAPSTSSAPAVLGMDLMKSFEEGLEFVKAWAVATDEAKMAGAKADDE